MHSQGYIPPGAKEEGERKSPHLLSREGYFIFGA